MLKRRYCDNPAPLYNGAPCPGDRIKMIKCNENIACAGKIQSLKNIICINDLGFL